MWLRNEHLTRGAVEATGAYCACERMASVGSPLWLRRHTLPGLLARLTPAGGAPPSSSRASDMHRLVQHIVWLCRLPLFRAPLFPRACLRQSLALYYALSC